jgi:cell division septal protein FtsQ
MKRRREDTLRVLKQRRLPLHPALDLPLNQEEQEPPFLRPKTRTRVRRARRGQLGRTILAAQAAAMLLLAGLAGWAGYARVMASERLRVARVEVRGSHFLSDQEVRELLGSAVGDNILGLDIEALKARLRSSPWVADAAISRALPDTLRVEIRERAPLALAEAEQLQLMDEDGTLIEPYGPRTAAFDLPIVRGLKGASPEVLRDRAQRAGGLLRDLGELSAEVSEVDVEAAGELKVVLRGAGEVLRMGGPPYRRKLRTYLELREDLERRCPDAEYFDLRFKDRIFVKEAHEAVPMSGSAPPSKAGPGVAVPPKEAGPEAAVPPKEAGPEVAVPQEPSSEPVPVPSASPDVPDDATQDVPAHSPEVVTG